GFVGDAHPLGAGLLTEPRCATRGAGLTLGSLGGLGQSADDGDLLAVDDDGRVTGEPGFGQASGEPLAGVGGVGLVGLLPAAGAAGPTVHVLMLHELHDYTVAHPWPPVRFRRTPTPPTPRPTR